MQLFFRVDCSDLSNYMTLERMFCQSVIKLLGLHCGVAGFWITLLHAGFNKSVLIDINHGTDINVSGLSRFSYRALLIEILLNVETWLPPELICQRTGWVFLYNLHFVLIFPYESPHTVLSFLTVLVYVINPKFFYQKLHHL